MTVRSYSGNAKPTTLSGAISAAATSIGVADGTGYPTGSDGPFVVTLDTGLAAEEKVLCDSRTGNTLSVNTRGWDGTTAADHDNGASVQHTFSATDAREANEHVNATDAADDPHPQYVLASDIPASGTATHLAATETTTSTTYVALTTPVAVSVTAPPSGKVLILLNTRMSNNTAGARSFLTAVMSGPTSSIAADSRALEFTSAVADAALQASYAVVYEGLTPGGAYTWTLQHRVTSGTGSFTQRRISAIPLAA